MTTVQYGMRHWKTRSALALALIMWMGSHTNAVAHDLPGSVLTFSQDNDAVQLQIKLALDDLIAASQLLNDWAATGFGTLDDAALGMLNDYFADHLEVRTSADTALLFQVESGDVSLDRDFQAGLFQLLTVQMSAQTSENEDILPIKLTYDAIMHEVRSHRATVIWHQAGDNPVWLTEFGYDPIDGKPRAVLLDLE